MSKHRVIIRHSFDGDKGSLRNGVDTELQKAGIAKTGTGSREANDADIKDIFDALNSAFDKILTDPSGAEVDHIWICIDKNETGVD